MVLGETANSFAAADKGSALHASPERRLLTMRVKSVNETLWVQTKGANNRDPGVMGDQELPVPET